MKQKIGLSGAVILGMNALIGAGIFAVPAALQTTAGPIGMLTFVGVTITALFIALSLARVTLLHPEKGAFYQYARQWSGHVGGTFAACIYIIGLTIAMGLLTKIVGNYLVPYWQTFTESPFLNITISDSAGITALWLLVLLNLAGAVLSQIGQVILIICTIVPLLAISFLCLTQAQISNLTPFAPYGLSGAFSAVKAVIFGFFGLESIPSLFTIIQDPKRTIPRALIVTVLLVGGLYLFFTASIMLALPPHLFTESDVPLSTVLLSVFPGYTWLVTFIDIAIIITIMGTLHSMIWAVSSLISDLSEHLQNTLSKQTSAILLGVGIMLCALFFESINLLFSLTALCICLAYIMAIMPLLIKEKGRSRSQIVIALGGIGSCILIISCAIEGIVRAIG